MGVAYNGDGDRVGADVEKGEIIWGDLMMYLF